MAKSTTKPLYDENGRWVEERGRIKGAIRKAFRLAPQVRETLDAARVELPPALKKDGTPGKRPQVRYRCAMCGGLFPMQYKKSRGVQVDHIDPVVPLWKKEETMNYHEIARGVFCNRENLQVLCSLPMTKNDGKPSCHRIKTDEENFIRRKWEALREKESGDYDWDLKKPGHLEYVTKLHSQWKEEFQEYLKEKAEKADAKRRRKASRKRKTDTKAD